MTNIRAVSKLAGVSIATVSRTLSTPDVVSDKTRKKVEQAVKDAGYKPNQLARNFRASKSFAIMVLVPNIANPFFSRVISGIQETAKEKGYSVLLGNTRGSIERESEYAQMVHSYQADGVIQLSARYPLKEVFPLSELPLVNICECFEYPPTPKIELDNIGAARAMTQHLIAQGHTRIAVIKGPAENTLTISRMQGYEDALEEAGLPLDDNLVAEGNFTTKSGLEAVGKLMALKERPTALFCFNDEMALGAMKGVKSFGYKVPKDISVAGFDDISYAFYADPPLTTISQPAELFGKRAVQLLCDIIQGDEVCPNTRTTLPFELVIRDSTAKVS